VSYGGGTGLAAGERRGLVGAEVVAVADDDGGSDEDEEAERDERFCASARAFPFLEGDAPERAEDDDAGHVKRPTGKFEAAHLGFAHGVKEKLEIPSGAGEGREEIVGEHGSGIGGRKIEAGSFGHFFGGSVDGILDDGLIGFRGKGAGSFCVEILMAGAVADVQDDAPDEICGKAAEKNNDEDGKALPEDGRAVAKRDLFNGIAGGEAIGEAGAHDTGKSGDEETFFQAELFDGGALLFVREFALLGEAGSAGDDDAHQADGDADENREAGARAQDFREKLAAKNGRHERAERGGVAERDGHAERHPEVAHGEAKRETAESPEDAEDVSPENTLARRFLEDLKKVGGHEESEHPGSDDPTEKSADEPVSFPGPTFDGAKGNVKAARSQAAEPVEDHADCRIGNQG